MSKDCQAHVLVHPGAAEPLASAMITGADGFIGRALVRRLHADGVELSCLDRRPRAVQGPGRHILCTNFADEARLAAALRDAAPEVVFHLAGSTSHRQPDGFESELRATQALLRVAAAMERPPRIVLIGSAAEYGPLDEAALPAGEHTPCVPVTPYGASKLAQTRMALAAAAAGLPVLVARLFNIVGPGMGAHLAMGRFARALAALPPTGGVLRTGSLHALRDVVTIDDATRVLSALAVNPQALGRVVPVCSGEAVRMDTMVRMLIEASGLEVSIEIEHMQQGVSSVDVMRGDPACMRELGIGVPSADLSACIRALWAAQRAATPAPAGARTDRIATREEHARRVHLTAECVRLARQPAAPAVSASNNLPGAAGDCG